MKCECWGSHATKNRRGPHSAATQRRAASAGSRRYAGGGRPKEKGSGTPLIHQPNSSSSPSPPLPLHSPLPPRSHSSLGFRESRHNQPSLPRPQGFDLQAYIRKHGSASDIRIGINGCSSSDEYFERYLEECESAAQQEKGEWSGFRNSSPFDSKNLQEGESPSSGQRGDVTTMSSPPSEKERVPLCWEDQLKKAEVCIDAMAIASYQYSGPSESDTEGLSKWGPVPYSEVLF